MQRAGKPNPEPSEPKESKWHPIQQRAHVCLDELTVALAERLMDAAAAEIGCSRLS